MSEASEESVYQTPDAVVLRPAQAEHEELEPPTRETDPDIGASPVLGPTTRSGKKRRNPAPVKSSGKKRNKMIRSPKGQDTVVQMQPPTPVTPAPPGAHFTPDERTPVTQPNGTVLTPPPAAPRAIGPPAPAPDLADLLTRGLGDIKTSMGGMEKRLGDKIDALETTVNNNVNQISILTTAVSENKNSIDTLRSCLLYTSPSPRDRQKSRMPSSA